MSAGIEAILIAVLTLALVVARPRGLNEGIAALIGAALVLIFGLVSIPTAIRTEANEWNIFLFFLGMMVIAALTDQSGVFDALASTVARFAHGSVALLYLAVFALGTFISLFFANDSAALVLTPIVYALVVRLSLDPLPFVFATTFIADSASVGLPVSNPLNVILVDGFNLELRSYISALWLPAILVVAINIIAFFIVFHRRLRGRYRPMSPPEPGRGLRSTIAVLTVLACCYLLASALRLPLGIVACLGAAGLALNLQRIGTLDRSRLARDVSPSIFGFIAGMAPMVQALSSAGVTDHLSRLLVQAAGGPPLLAITATTIGTALGANVINNLPMALVMVPGIHVAHVSAAARQHLIYSTILGCDLGPNLTHLGSLATFIWLFFLRRIGMDVSTWDYFRIGVIVTPFLLAGAILGLWITSG